MKHEVIPSKACDNLVRGPFKVLPEVSQNIQLFIMYSSHPAFLSGREWTLGFPSIFVSNSVRGSNSQQRFLLLFAAVQTRAASVILRWTTVESVHSGVMQNFQPAVWSFAKLCPPRCLLLGLYWCITMWKRVCWWPWVNHLKTITVQILNGDLKSEAGRVAGDRLSVPCMNASRVFGSSCSLILLLSLSKSCLLCEDRTHLHNFYVEALITSVCCCIIFSFVSCCL